MEYLRSQPPVNGSPEDTLKWAFEEFGRLETVIAEMAQRIIALEKKGS